MDVVVAVHSSMHSALVVSPCVEDSKSVQVLSQYCLNVYLQQVVASPKPCELTPSMHCVKQFSPMLAFEQTLVHASP